MNQPTSVGPNVDPLTVEGFGEEWASFDQTALTPEELATRFDEYFCVFPWDSLPENAEGFDLGCGSGRWARLVAPLVGRLHCIDPSAKALAVARQVLADVENVDFAVAGVDEIPLADESQDFGYSLGVLHHIPDTRAAMAACVAKLKPGAPFGVYLYYRFDQRPAWFRAIWHISDLGRRLVSALPFGSRRLVAAGIAATVYYPLARGAGFAEKAFGANVSNVPLSYYRNTSFYSMRTDALDRFGTRLEHRFTREEITKMMESCGLEKIRFSDRAPYWVASGCKRKSD